MSIKVAVIFGGQSPEFEISLKTARFIAGAIDATKYKIVLIGIDRDGFWHLCDEQFVFGEGFPCFEGCQKLLTDVDLAFPVLHGPMGEDGTIQGLFEMAGIPYVGEGVLSSAIAMDKGVSKRLFQEAGIPTAKFGIYTVPPSFKDAKERFGLPFFVKGNALGSSIGISKVTEEGEFQPAIDLAFSFNHAILIEEAIIGREFECSVLHTDPVVVSLPGELIIHHEFYTYEAKYIDPNGASEVIPAPLEKEAIEEIRSLSLRAFYALHCETMARVDFLMDKRGKVYVNEVNTMPGFTPISLYPKLLAFSGLSYPKLMEELITLALERAKSKKTKLRHLVLSPS